MSKAKSKKSTKVKIYIAYGHDGYEAVAVAKDNKKGAIEGLDSDYGIVAERVLVVEVDKGVSRNYDHIPVVEVK